MIRSFFQNGLTVIVFGLLYLFTAIMVILALFFILFRLHCTIPYLTCFWANVLFLIMGKRIRIEGKENIHPDKKYILVANHSSLFDIPAIASFFPTITWFGHERLMRIPFFRRILKITDYIPAKEKNLRNTREMMEQLVQKSRDHSVAIFPEGTRTIDGSIKMFYKGFIRLLRMSQIDILPVTLNGFYAFKPKSRMTIDFNSKLGIYIHKPIDRKELIEKEDQEIIDLVRSVIESEYHPPLTYGVLQP